jgi:uncharacterized membrane protein
MSAPPQRVQALDALRGLAMVWMAAFHLAFDLNVYGLLLPRQNFYADPLWTQQRTCIVSLFLLCVGMGQALAPVAPLWGEGAARFWRRWAQIAACALLVSAGSALMFPRSWIYFGVLHGIALMLVLLRLLQPLLAGRGLVVLSLALLCLALPWLFTHRLFDSVLLHFVGLSTVKPLTEDYVPVLPWLGVVLLGWWAGHSLRRALPAGLGAARPLLEPLARLGRWPLTFYMLHQPIFIGALLLYLKLR